MRRVLLVAGALGFLGLPVYAQEKGTLELGGFGRYTKYDGSFSIGNKSENSFGGGGRIGYFFSPKFSLELDGSFNATDLDNFYFNGQESSPIRYWPFHLRGLYHAPLGNKWNFLIGGGPVVNYFSKSSNAVVKTVNGTDYGLGGLVGLRYKVNSWLSLRGDGTVDFITSPRNGADEIRAQGINTAVEDPSSNVHLGAQLGLSIYPNSKCTKRLDGIDLTPNTASVQTGQNVNFSVTGRLCDGSSTAPQVTYAVMPSGTIGSNGVFSSNTPGTYRVMARTLNGRFADTSTVTVTAPPPPPRLSRIEISPKSSNLKLNESATYSVTGFWSDGASRAMRADECTMSADGNPTASGWTYTWSRSGDYGVTATCSGSSDRATATVRGLSVVLRAMFGTNRYTSASSVDRMSLDEVANNMKADPSIRVYVDGHTDWRNTVRYNAWLAQRRANFIQGELVKRGIDRSRLIVRGFGECKPAASNETEDGMAQNRRVEVNQVETATPEAADTCAESGPRGASKIGRPGED
ncbi:MAG: OmpA family protein [Gemmatimonadetes bacterium]|nr:OmpA family protein [Gemmatimonadota bacterium]